MDPNEKSDDGAKLASSGLTDEEHELLSKQLRIPDVSIGYRALYRYASKEEIFLICFCSLVAAGAGLAMPLMTVRAELRNIALPSWP